MSHDAWCVTARSCVTQVRQVESERSRASELEELAEERATRIGMLEQVQCRCHTSQARRAVTPMLRKALDHGKPLVMAHS